MAREKNFAVIENRRILRIIARANANRFRRASHRAHHVTGANGHQDAPEGRPQVQRRRCSVGYHSLEIVQRSCILDVPMNDMRSTLPSRRREASGIWFRASGGRATMFVLRGVTPGWRKNPHRPRDNRPHSNRTGNE